MMGMISDRRPMDIKSKSDQDQWLWRASIIDDLHGQDMAVTA
ncbi:hypothetical protein U2F10_24140 [Leptothoe sp. EHU-05/26/07-4]